MAKKLNVLFGFSSETIEKSISKEILLRGYNVSGVMRTTKDLIKDYINNHPEVDVVILKEYLDGGGMYSPLELTELVDDVRNVNVVIVLATSHRGKNDMKELYSAGILNAFFSDGKFGANPDKIAELATKGRTRKEAREYYRITEAVPDHINLTYEEYRDNYKYLVDSSQGLNIINRFVNISQMLYPGQLGAFIDRLPDKTKEILMKYHEFYDIANRVYRQGYAKQKYKIPKGVVYGITKENTNKELAKDLKETPEPFEPVLVPVDSEEITGNEYPSEEVEYEEQLGLEKEDVAGIEEATDDIEEKKKAPKKKGGLFGKKAENGSDDAKEPKRKAKKKKKGQGENIFDQDSDIEFDVPDMPDEDDEDYSDEAAAGSRITTPDDDMGRAADEETDSGADAAYEGTEPYEEISEDDAQEEEVETEAGDNSEPVEEKALGPNPPSGSDMSDLGSLSVEELKKLLGD